MHLHTIIEEKISTLKIYDKQGTRVDQKKLLQEYYALRSQLLEKYNTHDIVGIRFEKNYRYILTMLSCMSLGLPYIPLSIDWSMERIEQITTLSGCKILEEAMFDYDMKDVSSSTTRFSNDTLYIIFTSGSTGLPKGVKISREAYTEFLLWSDTYFTEITENDRMLLTTDFTFDISLVDISLWLMKSLTLYVSHFENNVFKLLYELENYAITTHSTVPYNYSMIMHDNVYEKANLSTLKHIMIGGARFPNNLYDNFKERLPDCAIYNFYGPTEATIYCSIAKFDYKDDELMDNNITIGKPFGNNHFSIIDTQLYISGAQLMSGYLKNPEKTSETFIEIDNTLYYKSGDIVLINEEGNYFIVGRKNDTIKVTGYRVNLSDIDAYILQLDYINNCATIAIEDDISEHDLITYIILDDKNISTKKIKQDLKKIMPAYQIPKIIKLVNSFPLNNSGKICKLTLKNSYLKA